MRDKVVLKSLALCKDQAALMHPNMEGDELLDLAKDLKGALKVLIFEIKRAEKEKD